MAKYKKISIPHNVKERLRHRKIQNILQHVGKHVPKLPSDKRETKAKCLRRVVLYMKFLLHKLTEGEKSPLVQKEHFTSKIVIPKSKIKKVNEVSKKLPASKIKCRKAQIVFLKKYSETSSPDQDIVSSTTMSEFNVIGNQKNSTSSNFIEDEKPFVTSEDPILIKPLSIFNLEGDLSKEPSFAGEEIDNDKDILPSIEAFKYHFNNKSTCIEKNCIDENCKDNINIHDKEANYLHPLINILEEQDDAIERNFQTDTTKPSSIYVQKDVLKNSENISVDANPSMFAMRLSTKEVREKHKIEKYVKFLRPPTGNEFSGYSTLFHDAAVSAFVPVGKKSASQSAASNSNSTSRIRNPSNTSSQSENNFPGLFRDMHSLCNSYSEDQDAFPIDIFSSGESGNITSSNEWMSNDETDCASHARSNALESPKHYPEYLSPQNPNAQKMGSVCDIEDFIQHNDPPSYLNQSFPNNSLQSKPNVNYYNGQVCPNSEKYIDFNCHGFNYYAPEMQGYLRHIEKPQTVTHHAAYSNDLLNFHSNAPEYYYLNHVNEAYLNREEERFQKREISLPDDTNLDFYENLDFGSYNYPKRSTSSCGTLRDVQIKQEIPDTLPDEEISCSFNNLDNQNWY